MRRWIRWFLGVLGIRDAAPAPAVGECRSCSCDRQQVPAGCEPTSTLDETPKADAVAVSEVPSGAEEKEVSTIVEESGETSAVDSPPPPLDAFDLLGTGSEPTPRSSSLATLETEIAPTTPDEQTPATEDRDARLLDALSVALDYLYNASQEPEASRAEVKLAKAAITRLERSFEIIGVETLHARGAFDVEIQHVQGTVAAPDEEKKGWIHSTVKLGLRKKGGKLIRRQGVIIFQ